MRMTKRNLVLTFATPLEVDMDLRINNPSDTLNGTTIKAAMDAIVASNALGDVVRPNAAKSAKYVIQQEQDVTLA